MITFEDVYLLKPVRVMEETSFRTISRFKIIVLVYSAQKISTNNNLGLYRVNMRILFRQSDNNIIQFHAFAGVELIKIIVFCYFIIRAMTCCHNNVQSAHDDHQTRFITIVKYYAR